MHVPFWQLSLLTHLVPAAHWLLVEGLLLGYCWRGAIASSSHRGCLGGGCHVGSFKSRACSQIRLAGQGMVTEPNQGDVAWLPVCPVMSTAWGVETAFAYGCRAVDHFSDLFARSHQLSLDQLTHRLLLWVAVARSGTD